MEKILGDVLIIHPVAVVLGIQVLQLLDITGFIHIIDIGVQIQRIVIGICLNIGQDFRLQIVTHRARQYAQANSKNDQNGSCRAHNDLGSAKNDLPKLQQDLHSPVRSPGLALRFHSLIFLLRHNITSIYAVKLPQMVKCFPKIVHSA